MADKPNPLPDGVTRWDGPPLEAWSGAWTPAEAAAALAGLDIPWCVVGGWAIDLALGRVTRQHEDLEIAVPEDDFPAVRDRFRALGMTLFDVGDGEVALLPPGAPTAPGKHQTWVQDALLPLWRVDVMREPGDRETWAFRRDPVLTAPRASVSGRTAQGIPFIAPQVALLFKSKAPRPKDDKDLTAALPALSPKARAWLRDAVRRFYPGSPWLARLTE